MLFLFSAGIIVILLGLLAAGKIQTFLSTKVLQPLIVYVTFVNGSHTYIGPFMNILTMKAARDLSVDPGIAAKTQTQ